MKKVEKIISNISKNKEVVITFGPVPQQDAKEPRHKLVISGPSRLLEPLLEYLTDEELNRKPVECKKKPLNCICNPDHWDGWFKICKKFVKSDDEDRCAICDHSKGCHK